MSQEDKKEASISGIFLKIRIDNLQDEAKALFQKDKIRFAKGLLEALNGYYKKEGLDVRFSDYLDDLKISYPAE